MPNPEDRHFWLTEEQVSGAAGLVAEVDGVVAGYLVGRMREPADTRPIRVALLESMYVRPALRRCDPVLRAGGPRAPLAHAGGPA